MEKSIRHSYKDNQSPTPPLAQGSSNNCTILQHCPNTKFWKFNRPKYQVLHTGWGNPKIYCRLGKVIETTPAGKEFRVLIDEKLKVSQQCAPSAQTAQKCPGLHQREVVSRLREVIFLLYSALMRTHLECCIQPWSPWHKVEPVLLLLHVLLLCNTTSYYKGGRCWDCFQKIKAVI